mgnify:FL=1
MKYIVLTVLFMGCGTPTLDWQSRFIADKCMKCTDCCIATGKDPQASCETLLKNAGVGENDDERHKTGVAWISEGPACKEETGTPCYPFVEGR